jgi:hypothetical protein
MKDVLDISWNIAQAVNAAWVTERLIAMGLAGMNIEDQVFRSAAGTQRLRGSKGPMAERLNAGPLDDEQERCHFERCFGCDGLLGQHTARPAQSLRCAAQALARSPAAGLAPGERNDRFARLEPSPEASRQPYGPLTSTGGHGTEVAPMTADRRGCWAWPWP